MSDEMTLVITAMRLRVAFSATPFPRDQWCRNRRLNTAPSTATATAASGVPLLEYDNFMIEDRRDLEGRGAAGDCHR